MNKELSIQIKSDSSKLYQTNKELKIAERIMLSTPGVGDKSIAIARTFIESGLSPSMSAMLLETLFTPPSISGRGHATRWKWFSAAVQRRYAGRLEKIRTNLTLFRSFISEIDEMNEMRDTLKGEGFSISFERAFLYSEIGLDSESAVAILSDLLSRGISNFKAQRILFEAARLCHQGTIGTIYCAVEQLSHNYE